MSYTSEVLADDPAGYWRLGDTDTTAVDSSGDGRPGTYVGTYTQGATSLLTSDPSDKALALAGAGYVNLGTGLWSATPSFTIEAWIKPTANDTGVYSIADRDSTGDSRVWQFRRFQNRLEMLRVVNPGGGGINVVTAASPANSLVANQTYHVAATWDGTTNRLYINGAQVAAVTHTGFNQSAAPFVIGANSSGGGTGGAARFVGTIDDVAYYPTALSAQRIQAHYDAGRADPAPVATELAMTATVPPWTGALALQNTRPAYQTDVLSDTPLAYWSLNDPPSSVQMRDESPNGRHGSYVGAPQANQQSVPPAVAGSSVLFNGSTQRADTTYAAWQNSIRTLEAWVQPTSAPGRDCNILARHSQNQAEYEIAMAGGLLRIRMQAQSGFLSATDPTPVVVGEKYHVVGVIDDAAKQLRLYVNGALKTTTGYAGAVPAGSESLSVAALTNGYAGANQYFPGRIDEAAVYDYVLPQSRIQSHYDKGVGAAPTEQALQLTGTVPPWTADAQVKTVAKTTMTATVPAWESAATINLGQPSGTVVLDGQVPAWTVDAQVRLSQGVSLAGQIPAWTANVLVDLPQTILELAAEFPAWEATVQIDLEDAFSMAAPLWSYPSGSTQVDLTTGSHWYRMDVAEDGLPMLVTPGPGAVVEAYKALVPEPQSPADLQLLGTFPGEPVLLGTQNYFRVEEAP